MAAALLVLEVHAGLRPVQQMRPLCTPRAYALLDRMPRQPGGRPLRVVAVHGEGVSEGQFVADVTASTTLGFKTVRVCLALRMGHWKLDTPIMVRRNAQVPA